VTLREQVRVRDPVWIEILRRLREGSCTDEAITEVQILVLTNKDCDVPDELVQSSSRHDTQQCGRWNDAALAKHCSSTGNRKNIVHAEDKLSKKKFHYAQV